MHPKALLDLASDLLRQILKFDAPADAVVSGFFRQYRALGPRERHALAETAYAVLRRRLLWEHLARSFAAARPAAGRSAPVGAERLLACLAWQGSDDVLRAALTSEEAAWLDAARQVDPATLDEPQRHNLPPWLAERLQEGFRAHPGGFDAFWQLVTALEQPAPLDLRVNPLKADRDRAMATLAGQGLAVRATPYSPWGLRVDGKPAINKAEAYLQGWIEVQDEGSQLLALLTGARRGEMVADFCAGAGGKTLALGAMMRNTGRLYAFDVSGHRLEALKPRLARSGLSNVYPIQIAHERDERIKRLAGKIDRVLVDAPCSGLGTLRRNPDLKWRQSPQSVSELRDKQVAILTSAARLLKTGGRLVYATCSLLSEENERVAEAFGSEGGDASRSFRQVPVAEILEAAGVPDAVNLTDGRHLRLWPQRHQTDGFFAAVWERR